MMDPQIIEHDDHTTTLALVLEGNQEMLEVPLVIGIVQQLYMHETSLLADGTNDRDGGSTVLQHVQLHSWRHPALRRLLPEIEGGLVHVDDLVVRCLLDVCPEGLHEFKLLLFEIHILSGTLPILVVGTLVLHPVTNVVRPQ